MINIKITYLTPGGRAQQGGSFPLRGRKPEQVAFEWIRQIKREVNFEELLEVIVNGAQDITKEVQELDRGIESSDDVI